MTLEEKLVEEKERILEVKSYYTGKRHQDDMHIKMLQKSELG
jgi:hypothetical protein